MNKKLIRRLVVGMMFVAGAAAGQSTGVPGQKFFWGQPAPDLATAQAYTYKHYDDGAVTGTAFTGVVCSGTASPFNCEVLIPAYTPGNHSITITATNIAGESPKSSPFAFTFVVTPGTPVGIGIK